MANIFTKILTWAGFRVMSTWFGNYVQLKTQEAIIAPVKQAQAIANSFSIINVGTHENVNGIVNQFAENTEAQTLTVIQQWPGEGEPTEHTVYRHVMYIGGDAL